jgi:DNA-binding CsgD family transcriptional regulator/tetratricopeptide (TPR) repeat protein
VGRAPEVAVLRAELVRVREDGFGCVLLLGEPGVGKTRLALELMADEGPPTIVLSARAGPLGSTSSFGLWAEALEGHLRTLVAGQVSALCGGFLDDLAALLRSAAAARGGSAPREPPRTRLLEGLAVLLGSLARRGPVLVLLDDVHTADASSWDALHYLARNLAGAPVLMLATARPAELWLHRTAGEVVRDLEQVGLLRRLELRSLESAAVGELVEAVLGRAPPPALVGWLDERTRGNPLFVLELMQALAEEGADLAAPTLRRLPEGLADRVGARLAALDEPARSALEVLAIVGRRMRLATVVALTGQPLEQVASLMTGLVRSRLVVEEERGREVIFEIAHPLIQEAIYEGLGAARRHALHRLVARSLMAAGSLGEAAPHFARSAEPGDSEAIEALCEAVAQAEARALYRDALTILASLVDLLPAGDERWLRVLDAFELQADWVFDHRADAHAALAIPALRAIDSVLERLPDPARQATVKFRLCSFLAWGTGELEAAERAGREARALFEGAGDTRGMLLADVELAWIPACRGDLSGWVEAASRVARDAEAAGERQVAMSAIARGIAGASFYIGRFADAEAALRRAIAMAREEGSAYFHSLCLTLLARSLAFEGRIAEAWPLLDRAREVDPGWREGPLGEYETAIHWLAGDFDAAVVRGGESMSWNAAGISRRRAMGLAFAAMSAIELGRTADAERHLEALRAAVGGGDWMLMQQLRSQAEAAQARRAGRDGQALAVLVRAASEMLERQGGGLAALVLLDLAEVAADAGDLETAAHAAADLREVAESVDRDLHRALAALGTALAHLAAGASRPAADAAEGAVRGLSQLGYRGLLSRARDTLGRALAPIDRPRARDALQRAAAGFDGCGAVWRRDRALEALKRLGEAGKRAAATVGGAALTPRERAVAALAARGDTAPEIARTLVIGERTVESHLARIYAKLGVASKRDLVRRAAELGLGEAAGAPER